VTARSTAIARAAVMTGQAWLGAATAYLAVVTAAGVRGRPRAAPTDAQPAPRMVALVPAHDEQEGIAATVAALRAQRYPADRLEVVVIADNCSDETAARAGRAGATVWERRAPDARGKGQALAYALDCLWVQRPQTEAVVVVDADCRATPDLCAAIGTRLSVGDVRAVQARYEVANAAESPAAALRWAGFALRHDIRARGKRRLGLSCGLFGTGMGFRASLLRDVPWSAFSITEDAEYHVRLLQAGERVAFVDGAAVMSAMPTTGAVARGQQLRWESGNVALARASVPALLAGGLAARDRQRVHAALEQLVPPQSVLASGTLALVATALSLRARRLAQVGAATFVAQGCAVLGGLVAARAPAATWRALPHAPWLVARKLAVFSRILSGRSARAWVRTAR
jgi:cellulose synthase/poly-beta-1,6-N-acetylglucosamine synthase-like glycosyltransferase